MQEETNALEGVSEEVMPTEGMETEGESLEVETPEQPSWQAEDEERARMLGWKHPDEWKGDKPPAGLMTDPREYIERAESILPFRKLQEQYEQTQTQMEQRFEKMDRMYAQQAQRERQRAESAIQQLQARQREAVETGDTDAWERARKAEDGIRSQFEPQQPKQQEIPAEVRDAIDLWRVERDWFGSDQDKTQAAAAAWSEAERMGIKNPQAILKFVDRAVEQKFPDQNKPVTRKSSAVEEGLSLGGGGESFTKLPTEAKTAFKRFVKDGLFKDTKEDRQKYFEDYQNA